MSHGHAGEPLENAARRELLEETGYERREHGAPWSTCASAPGLASEVITFFRARGLREVGRRRRRRAARTSRVHEVPLAEVARPG